ncbi:helix-turn-helix domain-containing protein [Streptococcus marmotae]|uniref:helix-turn-helix domain-containing protein n=1 Tax=Streptococcus marmotae TaxID=1825069 RepID=UPI00082E7530|nr:helix-turn-helix domain-containing protein [Streptococcus marmotae]
MDNKEFGAKVRRLRENLGITREQFCEDEVELTARQLMRIEAGQSKPTLSKITFIAQRLGMTLYQLMPDYVELPSRYTKLKYDVLRVPTYGKPELVEKREALLEEIYDDFYDRLPEEEKIAIDAFRSALDVAETQTAHFGQEIIDEYFFQIRQKDSYKINDLLIIRLYIERIKYWQEEEQFPDFLELLEVLVHQVDVVIAEDLFVLRDVLMAAIGILGKSGKYEFFPRLFKALDDIMMMSQDFQKKPILSMLKWKYELFHTKNREQATFYYEEAINFAQLIGNTYLAERLEAEWQENIA